MVIGFLNTTFGIHVAKIEEGVTLRQRCRYLLLALIISCWIISGCAESTFEITVYSQLSVHADIYIDGDFRGTVEANGNLTISEVLGGFHQLEARPEGYEVITEDLDVYRDVEWNIHE